MAPASVADLMSVARDSEPDADWIVMHHPDTGGVTVVTRESFDQPGGHKSKGWVEGDLTDAPAEGAATPGQPDVSAAGQDQTDKPAKPRSHGATQREV